MSFFTPLFLVGLAGMLLPVLIHLLTRDRIRKVEFSTLRFFVRASGRVLRRKRFREMILLVLRSAVCGLLAVAFARPLLSADAQDDKDIKIVHARTARVILADVSASMARGNGAELLRKAARGAMKDLRENTDAAGVIAFADNVTVEAPLATDFRRANDAVAGLAPTQGATNIPQALRWADGELRRARAVKREIVLISDLQRSGWQQLKEDFKLFPGVKLVVEPIRPEPAGGGVAILGGNFPETAVLDKEPQAISVQLANFTAKDIDNLEVRFVLGPQPQTRKLHLPTGGTANATFRYVFQTPGDNRGRVEAAGCEPYWFNTRVMPKIKVVLVDGSMPAGGKPSEAAYYLATAMDPGPDVGSPFECVTRAAGQVGAGELAGAQVAVLLDVKSVPVDVHKALADLLARGGGVFLLPGEHVDAAAFDRDLGDLAPCKLRQIRTARMMRTGGAGAALANIDYQHPIFEIFSHPRHGDLSLPKFKRYWEVSDSQLAQVLARFDDNRPAVLARAVGSGMSMMLAACPDPAWTDFARQTTFLPYVWQTLKYLAARTEHKTMYTVGDSLPVPDKYTLLGPDGKADEVARLGARQCGFYTLKDPKGVEVVTFAVNREPAEANPAVVAADEIIAAVQRPEAPTAAGASAAAEAKGQGPQSDDGGLWWWVVLATAVLLAGELVLGNHTLRH
jgi:hypothetical protein